MNTRIAFRNMEHNLHVEEHAHRELDHLNKFLQPDDATVVIDLVMNVEGVDHRIFHVELRLHDKHGELVAHQDGRDIYLAISQAAKKMAHELEKTKGTRLDLRDKPHDDPSSLRHNKSDFDA